MSKNLVIVESPAKAKTIESYLGSDFVVKSSFGHVRDLPKGNNAIDIENGYKPTYEISADKKTIVSDLKKLAKSAEEVWLATDDDREGEAISWHLIEALGLKRETKRIVFREITKTAIKNAISQPRTVDFDLVNAQQARRVLDRLVGFELSPILWGKVQKGLSAGRVQSVAVRVIVEREREIINHVAKSSFKISAIFDLPGKKQLKAEGKSFDNEQDAMSFINKCVAAQFSIQNLETKPAKKTPAAPFTTSTLQQEASRKLYFSVLQTMTVAQRLYEAGKITYMRTDSTNLSQDAINNAKAVVTELYGAEYSQTRQFKTKNEGAQEAHEAIRPTDFSLLKASEDRNEQRLYDLIRKRALASQMADAELERTTATVAISTTPELLSAQGEVIKFEGFLKLYLESTDDEDLEDESSGMLPPLTIGQNLDLNELTAAERFSRPAPRYTEASLVKKLEELGIGRPSTYAPTISTIVKRNYVLKEDRPGKERNYRLLKLKDGEVSAKTLTETYGTEKSKLFPTNTGMMVNDFLVSNFPDVIDYSFTADMEKEFDEIAEGKLQWQSMIDEFYQSFHKSIEKSKSAERSNEFSQREMGLHPVTNEPITIKKGKFGFYAQIGEAAEDIKPKYASLKSDQLMETITVQEVLDLFKLPRTLGMFEDEEVIVSEGKFGPYVKHSGKFVSLDKTDDPMSVQLDRAIELILSKRNAASNNTIKTFTENTEVQVVKGIYGPYIKFGKKNVKIPKDIEPNDLTYEKCVELAEATPEKKAGGFKRGKK